MKQKLFSILALLLMAVTGAWAADKVLINFPAADTGIGVAGTSTKSTVGVNKNTTTLDSYKLANGYNSGGSYTGNSIVLSVDGGFKKGDVITIAGAINNSDASKRATAVLFTLDASENITILNIFSDFINGKLVETMPVEESYTLETDAETLYLGRDGATGANLTTIKVVRPAPAGPTYSVTLAEGTEDADKWTISPASAAEGETVTITYNGTKRVQSVTAVKKAASTPLDNTTTAWTAGTFAVPAGGLTYSDAITVSGDVTLVLTDGETLTLNKGISLASGATLTIQGNGTMNVNGTNSSTASTVAGNGTLVLTSGTLTAKGGNGGGYGSHEAIGGSKSAGGVAINGTVTVSGGTLTATGGAGGSIGEFNSEVIAGAGGAAISGSVTLSSGTLTATGGNGGNGGQLSDGNAGAGGAAIGGDLTVNGGTMTTTNGSNGVGTGETAVHLGAGGKAVAGTVTDNR